METYYVEQAGNGIPLQVFYGTRSQRGHGFFGRLISRAVLPLLRYLGGKAIDTGKHIYEDFKSGIDITDSFKNRGIDTLQTIVNDGIQSLRQRGNGIKRRSPKKKPQSRKKSRKSKSTSQKKSKSRVSKPKKTKKKKSVKKKPRRKNVLKVIPSIPEFL